MEYDLKLDSIIKNFEQTDKDSRTFVQEYKLTNPSDFEWMVVLAEVCLDKEKKDALRGFMMNYEISLVTQWLETELSRKKEREKREKNGNGLYLKKDGEK